MPIKWTSENDQLLLLKILETHDISVDYKKVSDAWTAKEGQDRPTPRAINERLGKIKNQAKANGNWGTPKKGENKSPTTPRKRTNGNASSPNPKRARTRKHEDASGDEKAELAEVVKEEQENRGIFKQEPAEPFIRRVRTASALPLGMVRCLEDTDNEENKYETTDSEWAPPAFDILNPVNENLDDFA